MRGGIGISWFLEKIDSAKIPALKTFGHCR